MNSLLQASPQNSVCFSLVSHKRYIPSRSHSFDFITQTIFGEQYRLLSSSLSSLHKSPVSSFLLGPNILLNTLLSNTLNLCASLNLSGKLSHPYRATDKIIIVYILVFIVFVYLNWKQNYLRRMIYRICWLHSAPNFSPNRILNCSSFLKVSELYQNFREFITHLHIVICKLHILQISQ